MKRFLYILQYLLPATLGAVLLYLSFRNTNFNEVAEIILNGRFWVMIPVLIVSILVYVSRVKRWQHLYRTTGGDVDAKHLFTSLSIGYMVNFFVPRLGEISRAAILKRTLNTPFNRSISTILFERVTDVLCLVLIVMGAVALEYVYGNGVLNSFTNGFKFPATKIWIGVMLLIATVPLYFWLKKRKDQVSTWLNELIETVFKLFRMKKKRFFLFYTLVIWMGFYLMTYLWFFMFAESEHLSPYQAFLIMTLGVIARTLPIQAGSAGAYHFVVSQALILMSISPATGNALATVIHGFQTILTLVLGLSSYLWLLLKEKYTNAP